MDNLAEIQLVKQQCFTKNKLTELFINIEINK